jgi:hypothetical protein
MPTNISVRPPDRVDPVVLEALDVVEGTYPAVQSEQAAIADLRQRGAGDAELGRISGITNAISMTRDRVMRLLLSRPGVYLHYLEQYLALPSPPTRVQAAREHIQTSIREDGEAVDKLVDQTVQRVAADVPEVIGVRNGIERDLRQEGLQIGPGEPQEQIRRLAVERRAGATAMTSQQPGQPQPLAITRERACDVGSEDLNQSPVRSDLPVTTTPRPETIDAAKHLSYQIAIGHDAGVFPAAQTVVDRFAAGAWRFDDPALEEQLYCLYQDPIWLPKEQFAQVSASVLGITMEDLPPGSPVNSEFPKLFNQLIEALLQFIKDDCLCEHDSIAGKASQRAIELAKENLAWNLDTYMSGVAIVQIRALSKQLDEALEVINNPKIVAQAACGQRDPLAAILALSGRDPAMARNVVMQIACADARTTIYEAIVPVDGDTRTPEKRNQDAAEAAVVIRNMANWYAGLPAAKALPDMASPELLPFPTKQAANLG